MTADDLRDIYNWLKENGIAIWIDGGWSVGALIGKQTREHDDLDINSYICIQLMGVSSNMLLIRNCHDDYG
jgi:threonine aldolase